MFSLRTPTTAPSEPFRPRAQASARVAIALGVALAAVGTAGLAQGVEPFVTYFYAFAWWGWIAVASGWTHLRGAPSMAVDRPRAAALLTLWSIPFWLFFEVLNVVLQNWYYVGAMPTRPERLFGMAVCFATVLPGVIATSEWLASFGLFANSRCRPWPVGRRFVRATWLLGITFAVLPMWRPTVFYPLVWGATALLGEAWLAGRGRRGLLSLLAEGRPGPIYRLLLAGFVTGGLWESWNFRAGAKWIYTVPGFEELKLFEMPVLGFLGFPPFALECFSFACVLAAAGLTPAFEPQSEETPGRPVRRAVGAVVAVLVSLPMMLLTDDFTVRETRPRVVDVRAVDAAMANDLRQMGLVDAREVRELLDSGAPSPTEKLSPVLRRALDDELSLYATAGLGPRGVAWLRALGVDSRAELAELDWRDVIELADGPTGRELERTHGPRPYAREVRYWVRSARAALD